MWSRTPNAAVADVPGHDPDYDAFARNLVRAYRHWAVYVHSNQGYLGRCLVWCKREDALDLSEASPDEQRELFAILRALRAAAVNAFGADLVNYAFLGNETRHLHGVLALFAFGLFFLCLSVLCFFLKTLYYARQGADFWLLIPS